MTCYRSWSCTVLCALLMAWPSFSHAETRMITLNQLLDHSESMSPEVRKLREELGVTEANSVGAGMIPNPEIGFGNFAGRAGGKKWGQTDLTFLQPIELGGKRGKRIDVAKSQIKTARAMLEQSIAEVRLEALSTMYRLRQIKDELELLEEARETFQRLVSIYRKRPQLSPEQATSLFVFQLALRDCELQRETILSEFNIAQSTLKQLTQMEPEELMHLLPKRIANWPTLQARDALESPYLRVLRSQTEQAEQELSLAKADTWPTLSIGPSFTSQNQFGEKANILGVMMTFPIPVLNQNDGAKAVASARINSSRRQYEMLRSVEETKLSAYEKMYARSVELLKQQATPQELHKKHGEVESFFVKGLISSPLVIEAHRQMFDNQRLYHERELGTLSSYYQMVLLKGGKIEEIQ